jgi:hypothetical protein
MNRNERFKHERIISLGLGIGLLIASLRGCGVL